MWRTGRRRWGRESRDREVASREVRGTREEPVASSPSREMRGREVREREQEVGSRGSLLSAVKREEREGLWRSRGRRERRREGPSPMVRATTQSMVDNMVGGGCRRGGRPGVLTLSHYHILASEK